VTASGPLATLVLAAEEPSKVPFYVAGGVLAVWAVVASAIGIAWRSATSRPVSLVMMLVSVLLVVGAVGTAVGTSGEGETEGQQKGSPEEAGAAEPTGGAEAAGGPPPPGALKLAADPGGQLRFDKRTLSAKAGRVAIAMTNDAQVPHNVAIESRGRVVGKSRTVTGGSANLIAELKRGRYTFYCDVTGHREGGMEGTLTVR
jgi:plastocyanin